MTEIENPPHFLLIGCGGAGIRILDLIESLQLENVRTVATDTNRNVLEKTQFDAQILLGNNLSNFRGEGDPQEAAAAALDVHSEFVSLIEPSEIVIIIAGLGRGAGSGAAPQIAKIARDRGAIVIAIVMFPFPIQEKTLRQADAGLEELFQHADSVIVFDNQRIYAISSGISVEQGYAKYNEIIADVLSSLIKSVTIPSLINLDPDDFKAIFRNEGLGMVLFGESRENAKNKNESVVRECWSSPSLDIDYRSATGCLVLITGGNDFGRYDAEEIARSITDEIDPHADVVWCTDIQKTMDRKISVYAIMTGILWKR